MNYKDGNIYYKDTNDNIKEFKRLDSILAETDVTSMAYNASGDLSEVIYETGNKIVMNYAEVSTVDYDVGDLLSVDYFSTDSTHLFTQTITYQSKNMIGTTWSEA